MDTQTTFEEIKAWLNSGKSFREGLRLYNKYSVGKYKKMQVMRMSVASRTMHVEKRLLKILSEVQPVEMEETTEQEPTTDTPVENSQNKLPSFQVRLSSEFPKIIFSELPDNLKLLVYKRYDAWQSALGSHKQQHEAEDDLSRYEAARATVLSMQENWQIWEELSHWQKYQKVLGNHDSFKENEFLKELKELESSQTAMELTKTLIALRKKARQNINEYKRKETLSDDQVKRMEMWVWKFNVVSNKLGEEEWK